MEPAAASLFAVASVALATATKPWRLLRGSRTRRAGAVAALLLALALALLPAADVAGIALRWSGAALLVLLVGWPLATLALGASALAAVVVGAQAPGQALDLLLWHGLVPAWWALGAGWLVREVLPRHPFVYIFGRGFAVTASGVVIAGLASGSGGDAAIAHLLLGCGEGMLTGMLVTALVAMRPDALATYTDRLWAPAPGDCRRAVPVLRRQP